MQAGCCRFLSPNPIVFVTRSSCEVLSNKGTRLHYIVDTQALQPASRDKPDK
jgi:hypothetical protein